MKDAKGMRGNRSRNQDGKLRDKRDDTHMGTIEGEYDRDFDVRSDMQLGTFLSLLAFSATVCEAARSGSVVISPGHNTNWGLWGGWEYCPDNQWATR